MAQRARRRRLNLAVGMLSPRRIGRKDHYKNAMQVASSLPATTRHNLPRR
jgi:hypothetical protein